ncbi:MAG: hypothetical protein ACREBS_01275 [Nitrososphaerales archaeon]
MPHIDFKYFSFPKQLKGKQKEVKRKSMTDDKRSEAGRKGAEALKEKHETEGLSEKEREQRSEAGRKGGEK